MGRYTLLGILCAMLIGAAMLGTRADSISIAGDPNTADMKMDISLRDANIQEVLTALFNTTNGRYQLSLDPSVVGRISRLQLSDTPFEKALDAVLGTEYSYQKRQTAPGTYLYTITGRASATPSFNPVRGGATITNAPPSAGSVPPLTGSGSASATKPGGFPMLSYSTTKSGASATGGTAAGGAAGGAASDEISVIKLIGVNYLDLESIVEALGGSSIALFGTSSMGGTGTSNGGTTNNTNGNTNTTTRATRNTNTNDTTTGTTTRATRATRNTNTTTQ